MAEATRPAQRLTAGRCRLAVGLLVAAGLLAGCAAAGATRGSSTSASATHPTGVVHHAARATGLGATAVHPTDSVATATRPTVTRCPRTHADQVVVVSLAVQHLWLCHHGRTVRSYAITSGRTTAHTRTPTGSFRIQGRNRNSVLTLSNGRQYDVKYWIPFHAPDFGFHDAPWQHFPFGSSRYRAHGSHGCIHLPLHAIAFLYRWVEIGARVRITAS